MPDCVLSTIKKLLKIEKNVKTREIATILETAENIAKSSIFQAKVPLLDVLQGMNIGLK